MWRARRHGLVRVALLAAPDALPAIARVETNLVVLAFAVGAAMLTTLLIGLFPGLAAVRTSAQGHFAGTLVAFAATVAVCSGSWSWRRSR